MKFRGLKHSLYISVVVIALYFIMPIPRPYDAGANKSPNSGEIESIDIGLCRPETVYYNEPNGYTQIGEGVFDPKCYELEMGLKDAIEKNNIENVRSLIFSGANVNSPNNDYDLIHPLMVAVNNDRLEIARLLLDNGANVNRERTCCMSSTTALLTAVERGNAEMVDLLVSRGADLNYREQFEPYFNVFDIASKGSNWKIMSSLEVGCGYSQPCLARARWARVKYLLTK